MDGNGRWAKARNLPRTEGHQRGEDSLFDVIEGAIEVGVKYLSAYAFSTENWSRSPDEVRWLMGFNRDVIRRRRDQMDAMGVRVRWAGRRPRLWRSVISELEEAERRTVDNDVLTLQFCVNYGGRAEIVDATRRIAELAAAGRLDPSKITEERFRQLPRRARHPRRRPVRPLVGRAAHLELPALAVARTPSWSSWTGCGRTSTGATCGGRSSCTPTATGVTAEPCPMRPAASRTRDRGERREHGKAAHSRRRTRHEGPPLGAITRAPPERLSSRRRCRRSPGRG